MELTTLGDRAWEVTTPAGTVHRVRVDDATAAALGDPDPDDATQERWVRESFAFLLEREPASSVLARFDLAVIGTYFPEYVREMRATLLS